MSSTVDANTLVYASNQADPSHEPARQLMERLAIGPEIVYLFWPVIMGYLRLVTNPRILPRPMAPADAVRNVDQLLAGSHVRAPGELDGFWDLYRATAGAQVRGPAVPDAHLVALMRQHDVHILYTRDRGFRRYPGIKVLDPIAAQAT